MARTEDKRDTPFGFSIEDFKITSVHLENVKFFLDIKDIFSIAPYYRLNICLKKPLCSCGHDIISEKEPLVPENTSHARAKLNPNILSDIVRKV